MPSSPDAVASADTLEAQALDVLRGRPNPFEHLVRPQRPDDRFADLHSPDLLRGPRELLLRIIDAYRLAEYRGAADLPDTRVVTVLGDRGAGKTHMLEALIHRADRKPQLLVRPTYYESQVSFDDYLLAQLVSALMAEEPGQGGKPFLDIAAQLTRRLLRQALRLLGPADRLFVARPQGWQRFRLLWGGGESLAARTDRLAADLADPACSQDMLGLAQRYRFPADLLLRLVEAHVQQHERGDELLFAIRRQLYLAMARATLLRDGDALNRFLETDFTPANARPFFRGDVVKQRLHALVETCALVQLPVVFTFDNLEGFLAPQSRFDPVVTEAFMDSLAQAVDASRGLLFLIFAETGLYLKVQASTNQFALDRIRQGVPLHGHGPIDDVKLLPPGFEELQPLISERVGRLLKDFPQSDRLPAGFPYRPEFLDDLANRPGLGLRGKLLRLREEYSRVVYGRSVPAPVEVKPPAPDWNAVLERTWAEKLSAADRRLQSSPVNQLQALHAGLGRLLQQAGPLVLDGWRLAEVQPAVTVGENATYGVVTLLHWQPADPANGDGPSVRLGVGLLLARGTGMARDLKAKFDLFKDRTLHADGLVVLWPKAVDGDPEKALPSATREEWEKGRRRRSAELRAITDDDLRRMLAFPEWFDAIQGGADQPVPEDVLRAFVRQRGQPVFPLLLPPVRERTETHAD